MIKTTIRKMAEAVFPRYVRKANELRWLRQHARELVAKCREAASIEDRVDSVRMHPNFRSNQKRFEIVSLLKELEKIRPKTLCEIGADNGGTLALFASVADPSARILSVDIHYPNARSLIYRSLAESSQQITCCEGDSHSRDTASRILDWLDGEKFDFLFIDGDHSYEGVKSDFEMYSPFVRPGGLIAFHDIVPDSFTRCGIKTANDVGGVPQFWEQLRREAYEADSIIEDINQDGYGIGLVRV